MPKVRILGGGAQSDLWCQNDADVLGRPVEQVHDPRNAQLRGGGQLWARVCLGELTLAAYPRWSPCRPPFLPSADAATTPPCTPSTATCSALKGMYHRLNRGV